MSGDIGAESNFLPGEPGKYVTILDLKERWMKKKQEEEEEEEKKKACQRLYALKIGGEEDRVHGRFVGVGNSRLRSGGGGRGRGRRRAVRSEWSDIGGSNSQTQTNERKGGDGDCELVSVLEFEKSVYKKKGLVEDDVVGNYNVKVGGRGRGWYSSGKRFSQDGSNVKSIVSDVTENVDIEEKTEEVVSVGKEKGTRTNCPCHSKTENQGDGGFWVCKYVEPVLREEIGQSVTVNEAVKGDMDDNEMKKNGRIEEVKLPKKHQQHRKVREEMTMEGEKEDGKRVNGNFPRAVNHHGVMRKSWQAQGKREMAKGVKDEETAKKMQKEEVAYKVTGRVVNHEGSCQKNDVELQLHSVEPPDEIEDHSEASLLAERETIHKVKFRTSDRPVDRRKIYDSGRFKAEKNFGSLPIDCVMKDSMQVNNCCKKMMNQVVSQRVINDSAPKLENTEPMDCPEKSDAPLLTEMVKNSSVRFRNTRNGIHQRKISVNKSLQTERIFPNTGITYSGKFNGRMSAKRKEKQGLMWVKKGEAQLDNAGRKN